MIEHVTNLYQEVKVIIILQNNPFIIASASANRWLSLLEGLALLDAEIELVFLEGYKSAEEVTKFGITGKHRNIRYEYLHPILIEGYWKVRFQIYFGQLISNGLVRKKLLKSIKNHQGIIWTDSSLLSLRYAVALKELNPKVNLFNEMSEFLDIYRFNKGNFLQRLIANRRQRLFEREVYPILDGLALMTKTLFNHYKSFPAPQPIMLHLPMTVDLERFNQIAPAPIEFQKPYIAFVGVMNDAKDGVNILLESFAELAEEFSDYKLYLVGGWNYDTPAHLNLIKERRLENHIFWMKQYPRDRIPAIIGNADLLVLPRPDSKQAQGGFPTKLGEYLATGKPVCATTVGELPDYLIDNESVFFAQPGSVESFADAMRRALSEPENAKRVGLNGKKVAQKEFNKDIQAKKLHQFLLELQDEKK